MATDPVSAAHTAIGQWLYGGLTGVLSVLPRALRTQHRRKGAKGRLLTGGPGRLTMAMGIDRSFYGEDLTGNRLWIEKGEGHFPVKRTKRIGIDYAKYGRNFPWRMVLEDNIYVSK